ncbi:Immunity protein Imm5 [Flexibacter flexilis DSM 6793]|uniref:Immunity protein Imm5 n=1 Tax=Flexibacter flexilis DSM 6793 TaxID=927664 RepID=A0A1I1DHM4_9BACT|nr:Imm5 family immunity protein [Flexibacter flexilis]SFB72548.1 Immunity protein Imm5 [Flexibacter flexilis DSM 6793]
MENKSTLFHIGDEFYCRIIKGHQESDYEDLIHNLYYPEEIWNWNAEKGMHLNPKTDISEEELVQFDGNDIILEIAKFVQGNKVSSWLLARLWYLTDGYIINTINSLDNNLVGSSDGGDFYTYMLIENTREPIGVLEFRGSPDYSSITITKRSVDFKVQNLTHFYRQFAAKLLDEQRQLSICEITVKDPELLLYPYKYGWNGQELLRYSEYDVLEWFTNNGMQELRLILETALENIKNNPLHHLEKGIRNTVISQIKSHKIFTQHYKTSDFSIIQRLEMHCIQYTGKIWSDIWPNNETFKRLQQVFYQLKSSKIQSSKIVFSFEKEWKYMQQWVEETYLTDTNHKRHKFAASFVGLAMVLSIHNIRNNSKNEVDSASNWEIDSETDFYIEDIHFYAACAYANGLPYKKDGFEIGDSQKYLTFWRWWLFEAIPQAYR